MHINRRAAGSLAATALLATAVAACGSSQPSSVKAPKGPAPTAAADLAKVCPATIQIQNNWTPEAEQGAYYQLASSTGDLNAGQKTYTAPLVDPFTGGATGVDVDLLAGGPAVGYSNPEQLLYEHPSILIGIDATDSQIEAYGRTPTVGVVSPMETYDNVYFWDPAKHHLTDIAQIGASKATLLSYGTGGALNLYLEAKGDLHKSQIDGAYTGTPGDFVASGGDLVSGGYATYEPYFYTHALAAWDKPIAYQLIASTGYDPYSNDTFVTRSNLTRYASCLKKLVPMIQEAQLKYLESPGRTNALIVRLDAAYKVGGSYTMPIADYADKTMLADRIMAQPADGGFGSFDLARVQKLIGQLEQTKSVSGLPKSFSASTIETNEFIDPKLSLNFYKGPYNNATGVITEK